MKSVFLYAMTLFCLPLLNCSHALGQENNSQTLYISNYLHSPEPLKYAVNEAKDGSVIIINSDVEHNDGKYIEVTKNLKIKGDGYHKISLNCKDLDSKYISGSFIYAHGDIRFVMEDLVIDGGRPLCHPLVHDLSKFIVADCSEFIFHNNIVEHTTYWYNDDIFNPGVLRIGYPEKTFMDITNYKYAEISNCTFRDLFSNEGIGIYSKRNEDINDNIGLDNYATITNNRFIDDIILDVKQLHHKTRAYVSSWIVSNNISCYFANNYISGSNGSNINLHCHNSVIENNYFNWSATLTPNINLDHGGDSGIHPHDIIIRKNTFRSPWAAIQMASGYNIIIEDNTFNSLQIENPTLNEIESGVKYYREDCAFVYHYRSGRTQSLRENKNISIQNNELNNVRYLFYNPGDDAAIFDSLIIYNNKLRQDDGVEATPIIRGYFYSLQHSSFCKNTIRFSNRASSELVCCNYHAARIVLSLKPYDTGTRLVDVSINGNTFYFNSFRQKPSYFIVVNSELYDEMSFKKKMHLPYINGLTIQDNRFRSNNIFAKHYCGLFFNPQYINNVSIDNNNATKYVFSDTVKEYNYNDRAPIISISLLNKN